MVLKILVIGIFMVLAVMILTAMLHLIAPYVAALLVILVVGPLVIKLEKPGD